MYNINFDRHIHLINWGCIYWGIEEQLIEPDNAIVYANRIIEGKNDVDNPIIIELLIIDDVSKNNVLSLIERMFSNKKELNKIKMRAIRTLRYVFLLEIKMNIRDNQSLFNEIENIYADFDYPQDMENFIYYMPIKDDEYDASEHTPQENEQRIIDNFNAFMKKEFDILKKDK